MITEGQPYRLGNKSLYILSFKSIFIAAILMLLAVIITAGSGFLVASGDGFLNALSPASSHDASGFVTGIIVLLLVVAFLVAAVGIFVSYLQYRNFTFTFEEFDIKRCEGIINIAETSIPYRQIQDVDVERGFWYRMLGVSRLVLITAGHDEPGDSDDTDTIFDPIDKDMAEEMRTLLERKIGVQVVVTEDQAKQNQGHA